MIIWNNSEDNYKERGNTQTSMGRTGVITRAVSLRLTGDPPAASNLSRTESMFRVVWNASYASGCTPSNLVSHNITLILNSSLAKSSYHQS